jgi:S1-C subfamily serine protease
MSDYGYFSDHLDDDDHTCPACGDPLCPGCGSSVPARMLTLAGAFIGIALLAIVLRVIVLDGSETPSTELDRPEVAASDSAESSDPADIVTGVPGTSQPPPNDTVAATPIGSGLNDGIIQSIVQVLQIGTSGPCSYGSGTVIADGRTVLTNLHVVRDDPRCPGASLEVAIVEAIDERPVPSYSATVISIDEDADLAILSITPLAGRTGSVQPIRLGGKVNVGEEIFVVGFPAIGGASVSVAKGVVSGYTRQDGVSWIKTDASISGGSSGGAALNARGELIGVPTMASASEDGEIVDCRPTVDSNGDGMVDEYDDCQPIGGFLNLLSPVERAVGLLAAR